jgi:FdhD protein
MVQKSVTMGMPTLVAISAPTTLAIRLAEGSGLRMIALARADSLTVYAEGRSGGGK